MNVHQFYREIIDFNMKGNQFFYSNYFTFLPLTKNTKTDVAPFADFDILLKFSMYLYIYIYSSKYSTKRVQLFLYIKYAIVQKPDLGVSSLTVPTHNTQYTLRTKHDRLD